MKLSEKILTALVALLAVAVTGGLLRGMLALVP